MLALAACVLAFQSGLTIEVQVLDAERRPVPGAEVRWFEGRASSIDLGAIDDRARASGNVDTADGEGRVTLPLVGDVTAVAQVAGKWGWVGIGEMAERSVSLIVRTDGDLVVTAVDEDGASLADLPIALRRRDAWFGDDDLLEGRSDAHGRCVLRHAAVVRAQVREPPPQSDFEPDYVIGDRVYDAPDLEVVVDTAGIGAPVHKLASGAAPLEPVHLVVRDVVDVDVILVDERGALSVRGGQAVLMPADRIERLDLRALSDSSVAIPTDAARAEVSEGVARFRYIGRHGPLTLRAVRNAASSPSSMVVTSQMLQEQQRVELRMGSGTIAVRARLSSGEAATPIESAVIRRHSWSEAFAQSAPVELALERDGILRIDLERELVRATTLDGSREAWIDTTKLEVGEHDLGELVLAPVPLAIAGQVVDDAGAPISGAQIEVKRKRNALRTLQSDGAGAFAFHSNLTERFDLEAWARDFYPEVVRDVPHGEREVRIVLRRPAEVRGYLRLSPRHKVEDVSVLLLRVDQAASAELAPGIARTCSCDGSFELRPIKAGRYTLIVRRPGANGAQVELARREGIEVAGAQTLDLGEVRVD